IAKANHEIGMPEMRVDLHDVPKDRAPPRSRSWASGEAGFPQICGCPARPPVSPPWSGRLPLTCLAKRVHTSGQACEPSPFQAFSKQDWLKLGKGLVHIFIDDDVIIFLIMTDLV